MSLGWADHLLFAILALLFPIRAWAFGWKRLQRAAWPEVPRVRLELYRQAIVLQWTLVAATAGLWIGRSRPWSALGLVPAAGWVAGLCAAAGLGLAAVMVIQARAVWDDPESLARIRRQLGHLDRMIPRTPLERRWFMSLSVTAGICEEILYRGYVIWYLAHAMPWIAAAALASVIFGFGHLYQGWRGMFTTMMAGGVLAALYALSRSLWIGMAVHAFSDAYAGILGHRAFSSVEAESVPDTETGSPSPEPLFAPELEPPAGRTPPAGPRTEPLAAGAPPSSEAEPSDTA